MRRQAHRRLSNLEPNAIGIGNDPKPSNMYLGFRKQFCAKVLAADMEFLALVLHQILVLASEKVPSGCLSPAQHSLSRGKDISGRGGGFQIFSRGRPPGCSEKSRASRVLQFDSF